MLLLISDALTTSYLRPYLRHLGYDETEVQKAVVWYDPSSVATRNDRAQDADSGFEKGALSFDAWRRAHGFSDQDAPNPTEFVLRQLDNKGQISPELYEALLGVFAPEVMDSVRAAAQATSVAPIPGDVQNVLDGGQPTEPGAEPAADAGGEAAPGLAEPTHPSQEPIPGEETTDEAPAEAETTDTVEEVAPGEDAPPFPTENVDEEEDDEPNA